jgi:hypothetical protein
MRRSWRALARALTLASLALAVGAASARPHPPDPRGPCDSPDKRAWQSLAAPPGDADALTAAADKHPSFSVPQHWVAQTWFGLNGAVLLCRSDAPLPRACAGEWWRFEPAAGGGHMLADHDSFLCLASR